MGKQYKGKVDFCKLDVVDNFEVQTQPLITTVRDSMHVSFGRGRA